MNQQLIVPPQHNAALMAELSEAAQESQNNERSESKFFTTRAGILKLNGQPMPDNKVTGTILGALHTNEFYSGQFDPNSPTSPICWAFSETGVAMAPIPELVTTQQAEACAKCPKSAWGTGMHNGQPTRGKACKQGRRVMILTDAAVINPDAVMVGQVAILRVPVMSVKAWTTHVQQLALHNMPYWAAVTEIKVYPDARSVFRIEFTHQYYIEDTAVLMAIKERRAIEKESLAVPYGKNTDAARAPAVAPAGAPSF